MNQSNQSSSDETYVHPSTACFGRYNVTSVLGKGGFGTVYEGYDTQLERRVAIKVPLMRRQHKSSIQQYRDEAQNLARLQHPNIVSVFDIGLQDESIYIVTEMLDGPSLHQWLKKHQPSWRESAQLIATLANALAHAHSKAVVHRDIKPGNVIVTDDRGPVLVDFGLAIAESNDGEQLGTVQGTMSYMSPEQLEGKAHRIDGRTDIYALGTLLYRILTGKTPFRSKSVMELRRQILQDEAQPPRQIRPEIPPDLQSICLRAMHKRIAERYSTAGDMTQHIEAVLGTQQTSKRDGLSPKPTVMHSAQSSSEEMVSTFDYSLDAERNDDTHVSVDGKSGDVDSRSGPSNTSSSSLRSVSGRRHVTILHLTSTVRSVSGDAMDFDPEDQMEAVQSLHKKVLTIASELQGSVQPSSSQDLMICFGYPHSFEDAPRRAIEAALAVRDDVAQLASDLQRRLDIRLNVWLSVHSGMVIASGHDDQELIGDVLSLTPLISRETEPSELVITEDTLRLVRPYYESEPLSTTCRIQGESPVKLFRVKSKVANPRSWENADGADFTPLVGRDHEVNMLISRWQLVEEGFGQLVALIGEAGLGKSRLIQVIEKHVASQSDQVQPPILRWQCSPYHSKSAFYPFVHSIRQWLNLDSDSPQDEQQLRVREHFEDLQFDASSVVPLLLSLLGLPADKDLGPLNLSSPKQKELTVQTALQWVGALARRQPLLFVIEDLHWIDPSTLDILHRIADEPISDPYLCLQTFRPEFTTPWSSRAHQTQIALNRLTRAQVGEIIKSKVSNQDIPQGVIDRIADRTDGVPLFVEEFANMLANSNSGAHPNPAGDSGSHSHPAIGAIPTTLQDLLAARIDRIESDPNVIRLGASIGREFTFDLMSRSSDLDDQQLMFELDKLVNAQILFRRGTAPHCTYLFKHALIQDAVYESMLRGQRKETHRRIGDALQSAENDLNAELLAHHRTASGEHEEAAKLWEIAGSRATMKGNFVEAAQHLNQGMQLIEKLPETPERDLLELKMNVSLGIATLSMQGYAALELESIYDRRMQICQDLSDPMAVVHALWAKASWSIVRDMVNPCIDLGQRMLDLSEKMDDDGARMEGLFIDAIGRFYNGQFSQARQSTIDGWDLFEHDRCLFHLTRTGQHAGVAHLAYRSLCEWHLGRPKTARTTMQQALELAESLDHPFSVAFALHHFGWLNNSMGLGEEAIECGRRQIQVAQDQVFFFWETTGMLFSAGGHLRHAEHGAGADHVAKATELLTQGIARYDATGARLACPQYHGFMARAHLLQENWEQAAESLQTAEFCCKQFDERFYQSTLKRLQSRLAKQTGQFDTAAKFAWQSIQTATAQDAISDQVAGYSLLLNLLESNDFTQPTLDQAGIPNEKQLQGSFADLKEKMEPMQNAVELWL